MVVVGRWPGVALQQQARGCSPLRLGRPPRAWRRWGRARVSTWRTEQESVLDQQREGSAIGRNGPEGRHCWLPEATIGSGVETAVPRPCRATAI